MNKTSDKWVQKSVRREKGKVLNKLHTKFKLNSNIFIAIGFSSGVNNNIYEKVQSTIQNG